MLPKSPRDRSGVTPVTHPPEIGKLSADVEALLDAVLGYLPDRTSTETKAAPEENLDEGEGEWSPI